MTFHDFSWRGMTLHDLAWLLMTWHDLAWLFMTWHDFSWLFMTFHNFSWPSMTWLNMAWLGMTWHDMAWLGMARHALAWLGLTLMTWPTWPHLTSPGLVFKSWQTVRRAVSQFLRCFLNHRPLKSSAPKKKTQSAMATHRWQRENQYTPGGCYRIYSPRCRPGGEERLSTWHGIKRNCRLYIWSAGPTPQGAQ